MDTKPITVLDGSAEEREAIMKDFFDLSPEQSFQDIKVNYEKISDESSHTNSVLFNCAKYHK